MTTKSKYDNPQVGQRFGERTVASSEVKRPPGCVAAWLMKCARGHETWANASKLLSGKLTKCHECQEQLWASKTIESREMIAASIIPGHIAQVADFVSNQADSVNTRAVAMRFGLEIKTARKRLADAAKRKLIQHYPSMTSEERWGPKAEDPAAHSAAAAS